MSKAPRTNVHSRVVAADIATPLQLNVCVCVGGGGGGPKPEPDLYACMCSSSSPDSYCSARQRELCHVTSAEGGVTVADEDILYTCVNLFT